MTCPNEELKLVFNLNGFKNLMQARPFLINLFMRAIYLDPWHG